MKKYLLHFLFSSIVVSAVAQERVAAIDPGNGFTSVDHAAGYYDKYRNYFRIAFQDGKYLARLLYDTNFNLIDSFSYRPSDISFNYNLAKRQYFLTGIVLENDTYEAYANEYKLVFLKTDFQNKADKKIYEHQIKQTEEDERLLAVFPWKTQIKILTASFDKNKLFVYSCQPGGNNSKVEFDLPESNITDEKQKKETPKIARIKFRDYLPHPSVKPLKQTTLMSRPNATLYYSDDLVYFLVPCPYSLGAYLIELDLINNRFKGTNYFVNTLKDNASDNNNFHKSASSILFDSLLIIKNASDRVYEYYFFNIKTGELLKKYSSPPGEIKSLVHSEMKQKGTWASANEEKDIDSYKRFLRKGGTGMIFASAISPDSLTITNLSLDATTGIGGTLLDFLVPLPLNALGYPFYATAFIPPLGTYRNKIIYAHSRFSTKDLSLSKSTTVTTVLDKLLDEKNADIISKNSSFVINRNETYYLGYYSKDLKKIEVYKYYGDR